MLIDLDIAEMVKTEHNRIERMDFFRNLIIKIEIKGFAPLAPLQKSKSTYTLFNVIMDELGMAEWVDKKEKDPKSGKGSTRPQEPHIKADSADVAFWDHLILRDFLETIDQMLNDEVSKKIGRETNAIGWAHEQKRTQEEVVEILLNLQRQYPDIDVPEKATPRPTISGIDQSTKILGAVCNTIAVIAANGTKYCDLLETISKYEISNDELLNVLDKLIRSKQYDRTKIDRTSKIPVVLNKAFIAYQKKEQIHFDKPPTLTDFFRQLKTKVDFLSDTDETLLLQIQNYDHAIAKYS